MAIEQRSSPPWWHHVVASIPGWLVLNLYDAQASLNVAKRLRGVLRVIAATISVGLPDPFLRHEWFGVSWTFGIIVIGLSYFLILRLLRGRLTVGDVIRGIGLWTGFVVLAHLADPLPATLVIWSNGYPVRYVLRSDVLLLLVALHWVAMACGAGLVAAASTVLKRVRGERD